MQDNSDAQPTWDDKAEEFFYREVRIRRQEQLTLAQELERGLLWISGGGLAATVVFWGNRGLVAKGWLFTGDILLVCCLVSLISSATCGQWAAQRSIRGLYRWIDHVRKEQDDQAQGILDKVNKCNIVNHLAEWLPVAASIFGILGLFALAFFVASNV
jgi:hypothetical protein